MLAEYSCALNNLNTIFHLIKTDYNFNMLANKQKYNTIFDAIFMTIVCLSDTFYLDLLTEA